MEVCPDNSTECLLRALLNAQDQNAYFEPSQYNWEPLTFAFTVAIGVLAFVIAATTVFQGVLSAAPGRLKASREAIGDFAKYTESRVNLREFRVRTKAFVPFLDEQLWIIRNGRLEDRTWTPRWPGFQNEGQVSNVTEVDEQEFAGGWTTLLATFPQGQQFFQSSNPGTRTAGLLPCQTDYLPSDIQAAPAIGTIETIIMLAAFAGCDSIEMVNGYPVAKEENLQVRFVTIPFLVL
ncbi:hypothetical protein AJ79_06861 [Helicocarpus griseus UAMH5409]|uniref:Uncharacterized protein n=1 Tax=Helicocarpus griseus UAMH5409 TaxID=1447875 RepID=A0A2B7X8P7_9EURO|nr:hypothetical protein AJ79_06861 [Helicocarpus griseus UAMH5409]